MKRILIVKLWALGDILMATPLLRALKSQWPDSEITWIADKYYADILADNPLLHEVIAFDSGTWRRHWRHGRFWRYWRMSTQMRCDLKKKKFDIVINLTPEKWWAQWFNVAPVRVGLFPTARPGRLAKFYTHALSEAQSPSPHNTDHYLLAATPLGCSIADRRMVIGRISEERYVQSLLGQGNRQKEGPVVILAPFSTGKNRCWEPERYAALADWLWETLNATCIMTFGPKDEDQARQIAQAAQRPPILAQGASIREYIALIQRSDLVVCSDSSAMHIAGASGTPYVALFGPTPIASRAPLVGEGMSLWKPLPCAPCDRSTCANPVFRECMKALELDDVQRAVLQMLSQSKKETHELSPAR